MTRIIAGAAGSLTLAVPDAGTRPTSDRVRESLFSALESADLIADAAGEYDDEIVLTLAGGDEDDETDAASSLMIMAMGAEFGDEVTVTSDNAEAVDKIAALIQQNLDEA